MFIIKQAYINKFKQLDARGFFCHISKTNKWLWYIICMKIPNVGVTMNDIVSLAMIMKKYLYLIGTYAHA